MADLDQKAVELALTVQRLMQLTRELEKYSNDIQDLSKKLSVGDDEND